MNNGLIEKIRKTVLKGTVLENENMSAYTSFKTGGPAECIVFPADEEELKDIIILAKESETPYYIIGNGSNVLVSDDGLAGIVIIIRDSHAEVHFVEDRDTVLVSAGAGCPLTRVAMETARYGLTGLEFAAGIPGSLGGAVYMNAGAYGGEIRDCIESARVMDVEGNIFTIDRDGLELSYRHSIIEERGLIVLSALFRLKKADSAGVLAAISELNARRREKQPLEYPSAGSTFKRPEGYFAGKLIEDAGLRDFSVGGAAVSEKHCGFVINRDHATSKDIMDLINEIIDRVYKDSGVRLEPEVRLLGF